MLRRRVKESAEKSVRSGLRGSSHGIPSSGEAVQLDSGDSSSVRVAWLQERMTHIEAQRSVTVLGTCAAVAVKRVVIRRDQQQQQEGNEREKIMEREKEEEKWDILLRELKLLDRIRLHPHPNVVQCWGFLFMRENSVCCDLKSTQGATSPSDTGDVLQTLSSELEKRPGRDKDGRSHTWTLRSATHVDMCLSLCSGGTLEAYVLRKVCPNTALHRHRSKTINSSADEAGFHPVTNSSAGLTRSTVETMMNSVRSETSEDELDSMLPNSKTSTSVMRMSKPSRLIELGVRERDIVAILYALTNALRHTHGTICTLHCDIKPSNVLICNGIGKSFVFTPTNSTGTALSNSTDDSTKNEPSDGAHDSVRTDLSSMSLDTKSCMDGLEKFTDKKIPPSPHAGDPNVPQEERKQCIVEHALFASPPSTTSKLPPTKDSPVDATDPPASLVTPINAGEFYLQPVRYLPQPDAWRIQLADFGAATGVDCLVGAMESGTAPFAAPEVKQGNTPNPHGPEADIFSLGVTMQFAASRLMSGGAEALRRSNPFAAEWVDEDDPKRTQRDPPTAPTTSTRHRFTVPSAWRCARELREGHFIRNEPFIIPREWRCREELLNHQFIRHTEECAGTHAHLMAPLPNGSRDVPRFNVQQRRSARCMSCGKLHRNLVELMNAMTSADPSQRPPIATVLGSAAVMGSGKFVTSREAKGSRDENTLEDLHRDRHDRNVRERHRYHHDKVESDDKAEEDEEEEEGTVLWRPPSLNFLRAYSDGNESSLMAT